MSATEAQRGVSAAPCGSAATRRCGSGGGGPDRSRAAARTTVSRTVSWMTSPSRPSSTNGSASSRANASCGRCSGSSAPSSESVTRRSTEVASSTSRVSGSSPSRYSAASSCTTVGRTASSGASGRSRTAEAASWSDSGWPRTKRLTHSTWCSSSPAARSTSAASAGDSGPSAIVRSSSPNEARQTAPGASRVAITTRACAGSDGRNSSRSQPSSSRSRSAVSITSTSNVERRRPRRGSPAGSARSRGRRSTTTRSVSSARKARSSDDLPEPATPWTTVTTGPSRSAASSRSRPTSAPRRSASSAPSVLTRDRRVLGDALDRVGRQPQRLGVLHQHVGSGRLVDAERAERAVVLAHDVGADPADLAAQGLVDGRDAVEGGGELLLGQPRARAGNDVLIHARDATGGRPTPPPWQPHRIWRRSAPRPSNAQKTVMFGRRVELTLAAMTNAIKRRRVAVRRFSRRGRPRHRGPDSRRRPQVPLRGRRRAARGQVPPDRGTARLGRPSSWWDKAWARYHDRCVV